MGLARIACKAGRTMTSRCPTTSGPIRFQHALVYPSDRLWIGIWALPCCGTTKVTCPEKFVVSQHARNEDAILLDRLARPRILISELSNFPSARIGVNIAGADKPIEDATQRLAAAHRSYRYAGSLTPAETPLSDAENLFREPGPPHRHSHQLLKVEFARKQKLFRVRARAGGMEPSEGTGT